MSRLPAILAILILGLCAAPTPAAAQGNQRLWRDTAGKTMSAKFLWADAKYVYLKLPNGKERRIELGRLSNDDLDFIRKFREQLKAKGIVYEAPLVWETYRSRNFTSAEAQKAGFYPIDDLPNSGGKLEIEFRCFGPAPKLAPSQSVVLRMRTADRQDAGTASTISVVFRGKVIGKGTNVPASSTFDIPLAPAVLSGKGSIGLSVTCGTDPAYLLTGKSGAGPRLLIVERKPE